MKKIYILSVVILFTACSSVQNLYEKGDHEQLIKKVIEKEAKGKANQNDIRLLEEAFTSESERLLDQIEFFQDSNQDDKWVNIHRSANQLNVLQGNIQHYLPLAAANGYEANFNFAQLEDVIEEARIESFHYFFNQGISLLRIAENNPNNRQSARDAYSHFQNAKKYEYTTELDELIYVAKDIGTVRIAPIVYRNDRYFTNASTLIGIQSKIERELENMANFDGGIWVEFVYGPDIWSNSNYIIQIDLDDVDFSRESENTRSKKYSKEVVEKVRDQRGSVITDSLGDPILTNRTLEARVETTTYEREAEVEIQSRLIHTASNSVVYSRSYDEDKTYSVETCRIFGDDKAVPNKVRCRNDRDDFLSRNEMVLDILQKMRSEIQCDLKIAIERKV